MAISHSELLGRLRQIYSDASSGAPFDASAVTLATVGVDGRPSSRVVLLKGVDDRGFVVFTNRHSRKGAELDADRPVNYASLCMYWPWTGTQVRVEGAVEHVSDEESDSYFATRPRGSQIAAWASRQSEPIGTREELLAAYGTWEQRFSAQTVPRPPHWGGYRVVPDHVEFWHNEEFRLHRRELWIRQSADAGVFYWDSKILQP